MQTLISPTSLPLALAPMQDITDLPFWRLMKRYGGADFYVTEYFRVHATSTLDKNILKSIVENPTGKPVFAQMIGNDLEALIRTARELMHYPITGVDINLGCPAPVVYRKCAGGGLLRDPAWVDRLLGGLREAIPIKFTVKTRIGFDSDEVFDTLIPIFARHSLDLLTVHARTVKATYGPDLRYDRIAQAVRGVGCPVMANGNVDSVEAARRILKVTGAWGLMIGRGAIRNPWIFEQIRAGLSGREVYYPSGKEVLQYIEDLYASVTSMGWDERWKVQKIKKYMNFLGVGLEESAAFLYRVRRATRESEFFEICREFLTHDRPMSLNDTTFSKE